MTFCSGVYKTYNPVTGQRLVLVMLLLGAQKKRRSQRSTGGVPSGPLDEWKSKLFNGKKNNKYADKDKQFCTHVSAGRYDKAKAFATNDK